MERPQMHLHLPNWLLSLISNVAPRHPKGGTYHASLDKALVCCPVRTFPLSGKPSPPRQILERRESPAGHTEVCLPLNVFLSCDPSPIRSADLSFRGKAIPAESRLFAFQKLRPQRAVITENSSPEGGALAKPWAVGRKPQLCSWKGADVKDLVSEPLPVSSCVTRRRRGFSLREGPTPHACVMSSVCMCYNSYASSMYNGHLDKISYI